MVHSAIDLKLFYIIILFNLPLLILSWKFTLPKQYALVLVFIWVSGFLEVAFGPDLLPQYLKEVTGITIVSLYFYLYFRYVKYSVLQNFDIYARSAFWVSVLGIILCLAQSLWMQRFVPVKSILAEPAHFATIIIPSFYYYAVTDKAIKHKRLRMITILIALLLTLSSTGYLGLLLCAALIFRRKSLGLFLAPLLVGVLFMAAYYSSEHFRLRVDDTVQSESTENVSHANLSTYALVSNAYVAIRAFQERPLFGYGVGGHVIAHAKYIGDLPGANSLGDMANLNAQDADSLLLRTLSEFGIAGMILLFIFLIKFWNSGNTVYSNVNRAVFIYLCLYLLREGNWFSPELYFFVWIYVLTATASRHAANHSSAVSHYNKTLAGRGQTSNAHMPA